MKLELVAIVITGFVAANIYYDGKYTKILSTWTKYFRIAAVCFAGVAAYAVLKKSPLQTQSLLVSAGDMFRHMPIDRRTASLFDPWLSSGKREAAAEARILTSGGGTVTGTAPAKRSVSESKKKYVAASQGWKCNKCQATLAATYEVDHVIDLQYGGTNDVSNLVALCRNCHGEKTMSRHL